MHPCNEHPPDSSQSRWAREHLFLIPEDRQWATSGDPRYLGSFLYDSRRGIELLFAARTPQQDRPLIGAAMVKLPQQLQNLVRGLQLTFSTTDWSDCSYEFQFISNPFAQRAGYHINVRRTFLKSPLLVCLLAYTAACLWWSANASAELHKSYYRGLEEMGVAGRQLTPRCQRLYKTWQDAPNSGALIAWLEADFCSAIAQNQCAYPDSTPGLSYGFRPILGATETTWTDVPSLFATTTGENDLMPDEIAQAISVRLDLIKTVFGLEARK